MRGRAFVGGAFLLSATVRTPQDPEGPGYVRPYFHGSFDWPAAGVLLNGGVVLGKGWSVAGDFALRRTQSATISEESRGMFDFTTLSSLYTERERLVSVVARRHFIANPAIELQPFGGFTISYSTRSLTNRRGTYFYPPVGTVPSERPDAVFDLRRFGVMGGVELDVRAAPHLSVVSGARVHWNFRPNDDPYERDAPDLGRFILQISVGARVRPGRW